MARLRFPAASSDRLQRRAPDWPADDLAAELPGLADGLQS
jgi:hypothetical protein